MIQQAIANLVQGRDLSRAESVAVMNEIADGGATPAQVGAFLAALRLKGETVDEIAGAAEVMRARAEKIHVGKDVFVDTCGTGGDGQNTFNISTTAAFVVAGAGVTVAKHGNRSVSSRCGSADVLAALGVHVDAASDVVERCIASCGIGFLFAPKLHPAFKAVAGIRRELGIRSIFNLLGPLSNPAGARHQGPQPMRGRIRQNQHRIERQVALEALPALLGVHVKRLGDRVGVAACAGWS